VTPAPTRTSAAPAAAAVVAGAATSRPSWLVSGPTAGAPTGSAAAAPSTRTIGTTGSAAASRSRLGGGLVRIPTQAAIDPAGVVMADPTVAEDKRHCSNCGDPVGRTRGDRPGRVSGFCGNCGRQFDFVPKLAAGDLVGGQYDVAGCLAHGGLGWIYLARDRRVADRWVVLKGLLDTGDAEAMRAAVKEKRFLAEVEHPNIVKIFNFVEHDGAGYIVMEYVGGPSLKTLLKQRMTANGGTPDPLPVATACAYVLGILPAFEYLHDHGYVYCDFKPDNLIQQGDDVKLIDLGGVRRFDETDAVIYGTVGFQAPEIAEAGPSPSSDLYTIGRTLAVLTMDFKGYQSARQHTLPEPSEQPVLSRYPAFHRFLLRATATDPAVRFPNAEELATQLTGVLRQVVAIDGADLRPSPSSLFGTDRTVVVDDDDVTDAPDVRALPMVRTDPDDAAAAFLTAMDTNDADALVTQIRSAVEARFVPDTAETRYRLVRALLDADRLDEAAAELARHDAAAADWRTRWYDGLLALARGDTATAQARFVDLVHWLPGELAPQVALGHAWELAGRHGDAVALYDTVRRTDPSYVAATLGLARGHAAAGDVHAAMDAFRAVARGTRAHTDAQLALARSLVRGHHGQPPAPAELIEASAALDHLALDPVRRARASVGLLGDVLQWIGAQAIPPQPDVTFLGHPLTEPGVRAGLEQSYRTLARLADGDERIAYVDEANRVRPRTLV
jgi:serine/threonine-protein kinase PknG